MENSIKFYSTNLRAEHVTFRQALLKGIAPDKGLFMPDEIPQFSSEEIMSMSELKYYEIAFEVGKKFLRGQIPDEDLMAIVKDAYD